MKRSVLGILVIVISLAGMSAGTYAQLAITRSDIEMTVFQAPRLEYTVLIDSQAVELGNASFGQTFDFSSLQAQPATDSMSFVPSTGLPGVSAFPDANYANVQQTEDNGRSETFVTFFALKDSGVYLDGYYVHDFLPPFYDARDTVRIGNRELVLPLPLIDRVSRQHTDTTRGVFSTTDWIVKTRTFAVAGSGNLLLPQHASGVPALRILVRTIENHFTNGIWTARTHELSVMFLTKQGGFLVAEVADTSYSAGAVTVLSMRYNDRSDSPTDIEIVPGAVPASFALLQNYPNPFNPHTTIQFDLPHAGSVTLAVYNTLGEEVGRLVDDELNAGRYSVTLDASHLPSGLYFYKLSSADFSETKSMLLVK